MTCVIDPVTYPPGDHRIDVLLHPRCEVAFRLILADGRPAPDAVVFLRDAAGHALPQRLSSNSGAKTLGSTGEGIVTARDVPAGPCQVGVMPYPNGPERVIRFDFTTPPSGVIDLMVEDVRFVERQVRIWGVASADADPNQLAELLESGAAWPLDAWVEVQREVDDAQWPWRTVASVSTQDGSATLRMPAMPLRVRASHGEYVTGIVPVEGGGEGDPTAPIVVLLRKSD